ncbi:MAG: dehydratase [Streptosporangiales bacterium]|nr:dehydratase [Streptosporangiales bacterium]
MREFASLDEWVAAKGEHLGYSDWHEVTQEQVNTFADATGDHQWIHVDAEKAAQGPFGGTIAHGFLTLSLLPVLTHEIFTVGGLKMGINYGLNKVRFANPVKVGARVRAGAELVDIKNTPAGKLSTLEVTFEVEGMDKPACIAESLLLYVPA